MTAQTDSPSDGWDLPDHWTDNARALFGDVIEQRPDLAGANLGELEHAASLTSAADLLDEAARAAGMVATGSMGQTVVHPAAVEARLSRTAAAQILGRLSVPSTGAKTTSQRNRDAARARWSK